MANTPAFFAKVRFTRNNSTKENAPDQNIVLDFTCDEALKAANENNIEPMNKLLSILSKPYENQKNIEHFQSPSNDKEYQTFCGT